MIAIAGMRTARADRGNPPTLTMQVRGLAPRQSAVAFSLNLSAVHRDPASGAPRPSCHRKDDGTGRSHEFYLLLVEDEPVASGGADGIL